LALGEPVTPAKKEPVLKFKDFAWEWFHTYVQNNNKYSETVRKRHVLQGSLIPFFAEIEVDKIETHQVEQFKAKKKSEGLTNKTVNNHLTVLSCCVRNAQERYELVRIPKIRLLKTPPPKADFLTVEETELLLTHLDGLWREIVFAALKTGLRMGELKGLSWADINFSNNTITVRQSWSTTKKGLDTPKSNRERTIPMTEELRDMLSRKERKAPFVFADERHLRFSRNGLNAEIARACDAAGIRRITCHTLRHTFASHLASAGASMKAIQELLGHSHMQVTMRYAHLSQSNLRDAISLLEPRWPTYKFGQPVGNEQEKSEDESADEEISRANS
jgi:integrase